jgi:hypothetical protein
MVKLAARTIVVETMSQSEGLALLRAHIFDSRLIGDNNSTSRRQVLDLLTHLPLAIDLASAYMDGNQISSNDYLRLA